MATSECGGGASLRALGMNVLKRGKDALVAREYRRRGPQVTTCVDRFAGGGVFPT
jgi:hypothetical protein